MENCPNAESFDIFSLGVNYETANLSVRERIAFDHADLGLALDNLISSARLDEAVILSTCNRSEIYFSGGETSAVIDWICGHHSIERSEVEPHLYVFKNEEVLMHLARVSSGLDSMVLGETQIFGQVKDAFRRAQTQGAIGPRLSKVFQRAFMASKDLRTNTEIGAHSVSLAAVALKTCERVFPNFSETSVLFIGAGEMIRLSAEHFSSKKFQKIAFSNRSLANAARLAKQYDGESFELTALTARLRHFDIVLSCTASPIPVLGKGAVERALIERKHRPILLFDLAVPRDIEELVGGLEDAFLYSIDDLGSLVQDGIRNRELAVGQAEVLLGEHINSYRDWVESQKSVDIIKIFRDFGEDLVNAELYKAISRLRKGEDPHKVVDGMSRSIRNKFLDRPSRTLRNTQGDGRSELSSALVRLFELDDPK